MVSNEIVASISIDNLLQKRQAIAERAEAMQRAHAEAETLYRSIVAEDGARLPYVTMDGHRGRTDYEAAGYMRAVDASLWAHLLVESGLRTFMDAAARDEWDRSIADRKVPELTRENIEATFAALYSRRGEMFEQGVIRLFRSLSWDYKTNLPHKFGKRLILTRAVNYFAGNRSSSFYGIEYRAADKLDDLIRVLSIVDGKPEPDHRSGAHRKLDDARWMRDGGPLVQVADLPYLTVKGFRNGNAHVTFRPDAKVDALNRIIAKHYPAALPPAREAA